MPPSFTSSCSNYYYKNFNKVVFQRYFCNLLNFKILTFIDIKSCGNETNVIILKEKQQNDEDHCIAKPNISQALDNLQRASSTETNAGMLSSVEETKHSKKSNFVDSESEDSHPVNHVEEMKVQREYSKSSSTSSFSIAGSVSSSNRIE